MIDRLAQIAQRMGGQVGQVAAQPGVPTQVAAGTPGAMPAQRQAQQVGMPINRQASMMRNHPAYRGALLQQLRGGMPQQPMSAQPGATPAPMQLLPTAGAGSQPIPTMPREPLMPAGGMRPRGRGTAQGGPIGGK